MNKTIAESIVCYRSVYNSRNITDPLLENGPPNPNTLLTSNAYTRIRKSTSA